MPLHKHTAMLYLCPLLHKKTDIGESKTVGEPLGVKKDSSDLNSQEAAAMFVEIFQPEFFEKLLISWTIEKNIFLLDIIKKVLIIINFIIFSIII